MRNWFKRPQAEQQRSTAQERVGAAQTRILERMSPEEQQAFLKCMSDVQTEMQTMWKNMSAKRRELLDAIHSPELELNPGERARLTHKYIEEIEPLRAAAISVVNGKLKMLGLDEFEATDLAQDVLAAKSSRDGEPWRLDQQ